jgi:diacylglycerol kinase family enzyme
MVVSTSDWLKARIGVAAYVWSALQRLQDRPMRVSIRLDDDPPFRRRVRTVIVGNVGRLQAGVRLLAAAEPDDGHLDVAIIAPHSLLHWLRLTWGVLRRHDKIARMEVLRARYVEIISDRDQPRQLDGDAIAPGRTLTVSLRPRALTLCVPQPERSPDIAEGAPA